MPAGRPTKYDSKYCQELIDHMSEGNSIMSFATKVGVCEDTVYEWFKVYEEFSVAKKKAVAASEVWWQDLGRKLASSGNGPVYIFNMKNRFGWKDKSEIEQTTREIKIIIGEDESKL